MNKPIHQIAREMKAVVVRHGLSSHSFHSDYKRYCAAVVFGVAPTKSASEVVHFDAAQAVADQSALDAENGVICHYGWGMTDGLADEFEQEIVRTGARAIYWRQKPNTRHPVAKFTLLRKALP